MLRLLCLSLLFLLVGCAARRAEPSLRPATVIQDRSGIPAPRSLEHSEASLPPAVDLRRPLTSDAAAEVALWNNRRLRADFGALGLAEADLLDAHLLRNPRIDLLLPVGTKPFELLLNLPMETFWQRPRRIAASQEAYDQLAQSLVQNGLDTIRDARWAHAELTGALARVAAAERSVELRRKIHQLTEARFRAGDISRLETSLAEAEAGAAEEQLARFRHDAAIARERLALVLGLSLDRSPFEVAAEPPDTRQPSPLGELLGKALESRPDLRARELAVASAARRGRLERSRAFSLSSLLNSKGIGTSGILTGPGLSGDIPIFQRNQGLIARAEADVRAASLQYLALKQQVAFETAEARQQVLQAQESLQRLREQVLQPLTAGVETARQQLAGGDVSLLFVLQQTRAQVDAEIRIADAEAALRRAQAQLERSVGSR